MCYLIYCDMSTIHCTVPEFEEALSNFSTRYHKVTNDLWIFCAPKHKLGNLCISPDEYFITHILREYATPDSSILATPFPSCYYEFPEKVHQFLKMAILDVS